MKMPRKIQGLLLVAGAAFAAAPARSRAQDLPKDVDDPGLKAVISPSASASGWACDKKSLATSAECVLDGSAKPVAAERQRKLNAAAVEALAVPVCTEAARPAPKVDPSKDLVALCKGDFKNATQLCELDGAAVVLDAKGRFTPESKRCYFALGEVVRNTSRIAATAEPCCRCAAASGCIDSMHSCLRLVAEDPPVLPRCAPAECYEACSHLLPRAAPVAKKPKPGRPDGANSSDGANPAQPNTPYPQPYAPYPQPYPQYPQQYPYPYPYPYPSPTPPSQDKNL